MITPPNSLERVIQTASNALFSKQRVVITKPQETEGSSKLINILEGWDEGQIVVEQVVFRAKLGQEQISNCENIASGEKKEGLDRMQIRLMDITDTLVNVPIQDVEVKPVLQAVRCKSDNGS